MTAFPRSLSISAPAKINLFLHITGQRSDGYHNLQTVFQLLDVADQLKITVNSESPAINVICPGLELPQVDNLAFKAAKRLQEESGSSLGADISITKVIPAGGGLGGGSSDAASTLVGLNELWSCGYSKKRLAAIGASIGADVPVFVYGESAWAEGIGDQLTQLSLPPATYLIVNPGCHVVTAEIFSHPDLTRDSTISTIARFLQQGQNFRNDCEAVVSELYPQVGEAICWLSQWGTAKMTGTGSCVFVSIESVSKGEQILSNLPSGWTALIANGMNRSTVNV